MITLKLFNIKAIRYFEMSESEWPFHQFDMMNDFRKTYLNYKAKKIQAGIVINAVIIPALSSLYTDKQQTAFLSFVNNFESTILSDSFMHTQYNFPSTIIDDELSVVTSNIIQNINKYTNKAQIEITIKAFSNKLRCLVLIIDRVEKTDYLLSSYLSNFIIAKVNNNNQLEYASRYDTFQTIKTKSYIPIKYNANENAIVIRKVKMI